MRDLTELSDDAQELLAQANRDVDLDPAVLQRVRGAVLAKVAAGTGAAGAAGKVVHAALAAKTGAVPTGLALALKVVAVATLVGAAAAGGYGAGRRSVAPVAMPPATSPLSPAAIAAPRAAREEADALVPAEPPAPSASVPTVVVAAPTPSPAATAAATPARSTTPWAHDIESLHDSQAALAAGDPRAALRLASQVDPSGPFAAERAAVSLVARCSIDAADPVTREAAAAFQSARAGTPLAERVRVACAR